MTAALSSFAAAYSARAFLALTLGATVVYALEPGSTAQAAIALGICAAAALALRMRIAPVRSDAATWLPLAALLALLASFAFSPKGPLAAGSAAQPVSDGFGIACFGCVIAVAMLFACRRDGSPWASLDTVVIASGLGLLSLPIIDRVTGNGTLSVETRVALVAYTIACVLLLAGALRLLVTPGRHDTTLWLVLASCGAFAGGALSMDLLAMTGRNGRTTFEVWLLLAAALAGAAALTRRDTARSAHLSSEFARRRGMAGLILGAMLITPTIVAAVVVTHASWAMVVIVGISAGLVSLLLATRLIVLLDKSERRALELSESNRQLFENALLVQSSDLAVFACDTNAVVTSWNPAAVRLYGYTPDEAIGQTIVDLSSPPGSEAQLESNRDMLRKGETVTTQHVQRRRKDGSLFDAVVSISPAYDDAGEVVTFFAVVRDESKELAVAREQDELHMATKLAAEQLAGQVERMKELDRMKDDFVASVSHELRTPLTSIGGYLDLVLDRDSSELTEEQRHFLEIVDRNSQRLLRLVNDLLDVAHLGAGNLVLEPVACDAVALVAECVERAEPVAREKGVRLRLDAHTDAQLEADPMRLGQVVDNLVSNALKFTPDGGSVDVRVLDSPTGIAIEVADSGMGMPPSVQKRLFERFYRSPEATENAIQGTGLGLWITKKIVVAHGGTISVESVSGSGSTFRIELPRTLAAGALAAA